MSISLILDKLGGDIAPDRLQLADWIGKLVAECRETLSIVLPMSPGEREFLDCLNDRGEIVPELLTDDVDAQAIIRSHPGLLWKALNVREHRGL